jgi:type I restriction enzyme S subunit
MSNLIAASRYCDSVFDGTHDTPKPVNHGKLLITSKHISGGTLDVSSAYMISEEDYASIQKRSAVSQWDILFSMIGSVGEIYLEKNGEVPYAIKNMGVFSCNNEYKAKWLYYYLRSPAAQSHINRYLNGAVQKFLPLGALRDFPVIPFSDEKKNLVKVLA